MLELDGSDHVRTLIIRTLFRMASDDSRVVLAFSKLERNSNMFKILIALKEQKLTNIWDYVKMKLSF